MHWIDPESLPKVRGQLVGYSRNLHGEIDGVLLDGDRQVHVPPHMGASVARLFAPGDTVEARYVKPRGADVYAAVSVGKPGGESLVDPGPGPKHERPHHDKPEMKPVEIDGRVRLTLYAPRGEVCGAVLESGEQLRVEPKGNEELAPYLARGSEVRVWGSRFTRGGTTVIEVAEIGYSKDFE